MCQSNSGDGSLLQTADSITEPLGCPDQPKLPNSGRIAGQPHLTAFHQPESPCRGPPDLAIETASIQAARCTGLHDFIVLRCRFTTQTDLHSTQSTNAETNYLIRSWLEGRDALTRVRAYGVGSWSCLTLIVIATLCFEPAVLPVITAGVCSRRNRNIFGEGSASRRVQRNEAESGRSILGKETLARCVFF
jgi:hypothetical protein